jgi:lysosomal acid lipase/cholesteryl ester hydrolase
MGTYDIPAEIDYILQSTGHSKLYYIGHSMGTTMFFVMTSQRPEYNQKIHAMIALAPVAVFTRTKNPVIHFIQSVTEHFLEASAAAVCNLPVTLISNENR